MRGHIHNERKEETKDRTIEKRIINRFEKSRERRWGDREEDWKKGRCLGAKIGQK